MNEFANALLSDEDDLLVCDQCQSQFIDYIYAADSDEEKPSAFVEVAQHIACCPHCTQVYREFTDLIQHAYIEPTASIENIHFDASFLNIGSSQDSSRARTRPSFWDTAGTLFIRITEDMVRAWQRPSLGGVGLKSAADDQTLYALSEAEVADMNVTVTAAPEAKNPDLCELTVEVNILGSGGWPHLAGTEVSVKHQNGSHSQIKRTDGFGEALFDGIAIVDLAQLLITVNRHTRKRHPSTFVT